MKKLLVVLFTGLLVLSCSKNSSNEVELIGKWQLVEIYADPGDGSGTFETVESDKEIEFLSNNTVVSNGALCTMGMSSDQTTGSYDPESSYIEPQDCSGSNVRINYQIVDSKLQLRYMCIEACVEKYVKVN